jgi:predicted extracellular nuclease
MKQRATALLIAATMWLTTAAAFGQIAGPDIASIQGSAHISPLRRERVEGVRGIVTAVAPGHGFYMESPEPDDDPATSEGIYVDGFRLPAVQTGDLVSVAGRVEEDFPADRRPAIFPSPRLPVPRLRYWTTEGRCAHR